MNDKEIELLLEDGGEFIPLRESVYITLRTAILRGTLKPGERLLEIPLSEKLGVSRTPIREAIRKLEREGLVNMKPRHGAIVASITEEGLKEVLEVRKDLDVLTYTLACDRISAESLDELEKACERFEEATRGKDASLIAKADVQLHSIIVEATGNKTLATIVESLSEQMYRYRFEYIKDTTDYETLVREHRLIFESIREGDKEKASVLARTHIDNQEKSILNILRNEK